MTEEATPAALRLSEGLAGLRGWWSAWRSRRYWTPERQLEHLRLMVQGDHRWLAHDKTADALTTRYLAALEPDWYTRYHADICHFRREIGLEPVTAFTAINSTENVARLNRIASGTPKYGDGPLPERGWDGDPWKADRDAQMNPATDGDPGRF